MGSIPRLGSVNAALVSIYFAQVWGNDAVRALTSPYHGFENPSHATAAAYFRNLFDFTLDGLIRTAQVLAGIKLVVAVAFVAYLIDFARALVMRREPNRETLDWVLLVASLAIVLWAWPALGSGEPGLIRLHATQFLLLTGAMVVVVIERQIEEGAKRARTNATEPDEAPTVAVSSAGAATLPQAR
jgi:undecaprenyl pyrophosphate phosphatase UppP